MLGPTMANTLVSAEVVRGGKLTYRDASLSAVAFDGIH